MAYVPATILVVDDSPIIREMVSRGLRFAGFEVMEAAHVDQALGALRLASELPAAVVSDVDMPGQSVRVLIDAVRRASAAIPILIISGDVTEPKVQQLIDAGEVAFLAKPFTWDDLIRSIRRLLHG